MIGTNDRERAPPGGRRSFFPWSSGAPERKATVPKDARVYAVGDIHGQAGLLDELNALILADSADWRATGGRTVVVYLGDYVDRGPDSAGVLERLLNTPPELEAIFLRGNHDQVLLDFLDDPSVYRMWREFGGMETLVSYRVLPPLCDDDQAFARTRDEFKAVLPATHQNFLRGLQHFASIGGYYLVHAGVRPGIPLAEQRVEDQLWIRGEFLGSAADFGAVVVHGHTPSEEPVERPNRICVDTGAYVTGRLTAVVLEGAARRFIQAQGR